ncbi:MAG: hypothetical protein Q7U54_16785 [Bacteroidales bacterium]|nr:hypothetical protein [Bacteroidales bacterium]
MKQIRLFLILSILAVASATGFAQTTVTGHVFAEVVESVSASSYSQSSVTIQRNQTEGIDFGQIDIKSAASASCSLILGRALLTSNTNQQIAMETSAYSTQSLEGNAINGIQSINLQCLPNTSELDVAATQYTGNINIVLAYN